jgi:spore maturation protein CgeB
VRIVVFGLAVSSSWGNGHATLWRGLGRALAARGHRLTFFERDQPFYAAHRDTTAPAGIDLVIYQRWPDVELQARRAVAAADVAMLTSYCPDAGPASDLVLEAPRACRCYYDLDTPITLAALDAGAPIPYLPRAGLGPFDLVLSYVGGRALELLRTRLGAGRVAPLYGSVDPDVHKPQPARSEWAGALSYLGTYSDDRQAALEALFLRLADRRPEQRFFLAGAQYPQAFPWRNNVHFVQHLPPHEHGVFLSSSPITLNVTRAAMASVGFCPSGRFFEAAACGVPVLTDTWEGLNTFFEPGREVLTARDTDEAEAALARSPDELIRIGWRARERALAQHTAWHRAAELEALVR